MIQTLTRHQKLMSKQQLADFLQVSESTIDRWRKQGLPWERAGVKLIRFDADEVNKWLGSRESNEFPLGIKR